jgi:hypothetical protein
MTGNHSSKGWISQLVLFLLLLKVLCQLGSNLFISFWVYLAGLGENSYWLPKMHGELMSCANDSRLHNASWMGQVAIENNIKLSTELQKSWKGR